MISGDMAHGRNPLQTIVTYVGDNPARRCVDAFDSHGRVNSHVQDNKASEVIGAAKPALDQALTYERVTAMLEDISRFGY
jgi:hypothetical protein